MINIQNSQIIYYGRDQQVTVYGDFSDTKKYYIVPAPRIVTSDGIPQFTITKYTKTSGNVAGLCAFDVELFVTEDAKHAVTQKLGADITFGQFDWVAVDTYFEYDIEGESQLAVGSPSLYGDNRATFLVELATDVAVTTFINAFRGTFGSLSPFRVKYEVTVLTKLPAVDVVVSYDAQIAINYETQYESHKNIWGQSKQIAVGVKQQLKESGAGDVNIEWSGKHSDEDRQRVHDWAFTTLEKLVSDSLDTALARSGGASPVAYVGSFTRTYSENQVVEWAIITRNPLPAYDEDTFKRYILKEIDTRELAVEFSLVGQLTSADGGKAIIDRVDVTVQYPTKTTNNTFTLRPQMASKLYMAPGNMVGGSFDPEYKYQYKVFFANQNPPFTSDFKPSSSTLVQILPAELGIRQTTFIGSNIPFGDALNKGKVDKVVIDFFFQRPGGEPNKVQSQVMTQNGGTGTVFSSLFPLPVTNTYTYRLTYQMADSSLVVMDAANAFGSANKDLVMILNPLMEQTFTLRANVPKKKGTDPRIDNIFFTARYADQTNRVEQGHDYDFNPPKTAPSGVASAEPWKITVPNNAGAAFYEFNGQILYSNGENSVNGLRVQARNRLLTISPADEPYSIEVDASRVDWNVVDQVVVTLMQQGPTFAAVAPLAAIFVPGSQGRTLDGTTRNTVSYTLLSPENKNQDEKRYYLIQRPRVEKTIMFYYNASYIRKDGTVGYIDETSVVNKLVLILPPDGKAEQPKALTAVLNFPETRSRLAS